MFGTDNDFAGLAEIAPFLAPDLIHITAISDDAIRTRRVW
jgi:hypothetical protein